MFLNSIFTLILADNVAQACISLRLRNSREFGEKFKFTKFSGSPEPGA
jgi:hypothetical protein